MQNSNNKQLLDELINAPWYQSSLGPKISSTVKSLAALLIPLLINLGWIKTGLAWLDSAIDVVCILGFGGYALYSYIRSKARYQAVLGALTDQVKSLGGVPPLHV